MIQETLTLGSMISKKSDHVPNEQTGCHEDHSIRHVFYFFRTYSASDSVRIGFLIRMRSNGRVFGVTYEIFDPTETICDDDRYVNQRIHQFFCVRLSSNL